MSRSVSNNTEWQLTPIIFTNIACTFNFITELDLLASYLNVQAPQNVPRFLDSSTVINDALSLSLKTKKCYAFPPFSLIVAALGNIPEDQVTEIMIIPDLVPFNAASPTRYRKLFAQRFVCSTNCFSLRCL